MIPSLGNIVLSWIFFNIFLIFLILHSNSEASSFNSKQNLDFDNLTYTVTVDTPTYFFITWGVPNWNVRLNYAIQIW